jgi:hypothetical protein
MIDGEIPAVAMIREFLALPITVSEFVKTPKYIMYYPACEFHSFIG